MFQFKIIPDDGEPYHITATSRDVYAWEKINHGKTFSGLMANMAMTDMFALAHQAARRQGMYSGTLKEFSDTCEIDYDSEDEEPHPFPQAPSPEPASSSPSVAASRRPSGRKKASGR